MPRPWPIWVASVLVLAGLPAAAQVTQAPLLDVVASGSDVRLSWQPAAGATGYRVYRTSDLAQPFQEIGRTAATEFTDLGALPAPPDRYNYMVRGEDATGLGPESNLGFKVNLTLDCSATPCPISVPLRFWPSGVAGATQTSRDVCGLNPAIRQVRHLDTSPASCGLFQAQSCSLPVTRFTLTPGEGYWLLSGGGSPFVLDLVGAHDDAYRPGGPRSVALVKCGGCPAPSQNLVSLPYHSLARRASDLCTELGTAGQPLVAVEDGLGGYPGAPFFFCGTAIGDFDLEPARAYTLRVGADAAWQPAVR